MDLRDGDAGQVSNFDFRSAMDFSTLHPHSTQKINARKLFNSLQTLGVADHANVLVLSTPAFVESLTSGASTLHSVLIQLCSTLLAPTFTTRTLVIPEVGPANNGLVYGSGQELNTQADLWAVDLPSDDHAHSYGEFLRQQPTAQRSQHPVWSFAAIGENATACLRQQSLQNPFAPLRWLSAHNGIFLCLGGTPSHNVAHWLAQQRAGLPTYVRWALLSDRVVEVPLYPSQQTAHPIVADFAKTTRIGEFPCYALPLCRYLAMEEDTLQMNAYSTMP
jgi:aminoglycoside 3-N-acetyltransferase